MNSPVNLQKRDNIAVIVVDSPPVNALSHAVRAGIIECLGRAESDAAIEAIVLACAGRTFIAGADIREFGKPLKKPDLRDMLDVLDRFPKLTVAAIHGTALGGGLETAMCCNYRIALGSARVGLPESKLGLLPGAGGTQRLPRLIGAERALDMMISGAPASAADARAWGIIDEIVSADSVTDAAVDFARDLVASGADRPRASTRKVDSVAGDFFATYRDRIARRTRGYEAPERIVQCVEAAVSQTFDAGMKIERELFEACMASSQSVALRHLFFAERAAGKVPGLDASAGPRAIQKVGVIGAGTMGSGIALACMAAGLPVVLLDTDADGLTRGSDAIRTNLEAQVTKGRIDRATSDQRLALLSTEHSYHSLRRADLVIEAVFETMTIKKQVFGELDAVCKPGAILATNTSTLDVDQIAQSTKRPTDVIGLHFFSPAHVMRLLEIVRGAATADDVVVSALQFAKQIRKLGVVVGNCFGFVGNRMLYAYGRENQFMLLEGAAPEYIDGVLTDWGMAMGPNAVGDLAGLDVGYKVRAERSDLPEDPRYYRIATLLAEQGRFGQKTGRGTFRYEPGSRTPMPDPEVQAMIHAEADRLGVAQRDIDREEIIERSIYALVVEGCRLLEEGIAARSGDIDLVWTNGYGFPPWRGGPMCYADSVGLKKVYDTVCKFEQQFGSADWSPPDLLRQLAHDGAGLADFSLRPGGVSDA